MTCALCAASSSFVDQADRRCAFPDGAEFRSENLHCGTMQALVGLATFSQPSRQWNACIVPGGDRFIVLVWTGLGAAAIDEALVVSAEEGCEQLTLEIAAAAIAARTSRRGST